MKITRVEIFHYPGGKWSPPLDPVIIRVHTDDGLTGLGEVGLAYGVGYSAGIGMVREMAEHFLIGIDPLQNEVVWEEIFRKGCWTLGGGPVVYGGMSAIDEALWDIRGKAFDAPVYLLLGGKKNPRIRAYASQIQNGWTDLFIQKFAVRPEDYAEGALRAVAEGYTAVKVDPLGVDENGIRRGWDLTKILTANQMKVIYSRLAAIRDAVGPNVDILLEAHSLPSVTTAIQLGGLVEDLNCYFYEEPVNNLDVGAMVKVSEKVKIPLAAGERIYTRWGYRKYLEQRCLDVIQPDVQLVGGITECKKICDMAYTYDVSVQCHQAGSPISIACSLHLEAAIPNFIIHEHNWQNIKKEVAGLIKQDLQPKDGYFTVSDEPGFGIELDDKIMADYLVSVVE